jgi:DNA polymerase family B
MLALHKAKPLNKPKRKTLPHSLLFLDTETTETSETDDTKQLVFKSGCLIFVELDDNLQTKTREIYNIYATENFYEYLDILSRQYSDLYIFAHNLGFDLRILQSFHSLFKLGWNSKAPIINNRLFVWDLHLANRNLHFVDTANLGVSTIDELGRIIGKPKLDIDFNAATKQELEIYCQRDCEIIEEFVIEYIKFLHYYDLGGFKKTIASQALHTYLYKFYDGDIYPHRLPKVIELEELAYHGGRTEAFYIGELPDDNYTLLDINSMYASILHTQAMPVNLLSYKEKATTAIPDKIMEHHYVIAEVILNTDCAAYPKIIDNRLCFPVGIFNTVLHHAELLCAIKHKHIVRILRYAVYAKDKCFSSYSDFFLNERSKHKLTGNTIWDDICKKFNNALYGKMAQHGYRRKNIDIVNEELFGRLPYFDHVRNTHGQFIIWNGKVIDEHKQGLARHSSLAIAGAVTAYGRMMLYELGQIAGLENWFYCDTDSLMVNTQGAVNLIDYIDSKTTGKLKLVKISTHAHIHGAKDYKFGAIEHIKGIKSNAVRLKEDTFEQWNFQSVLAWLNGGGQGTVRLTRIIKSRKSPYKKGKLDVTNSGRVTPFSLDY